MDHRTGWTKFKQIREANEMGYVRLVYKKNTK